MKRVGSWSVGATLVGALAAPALGGETPLYQPRPDWVMPAPPTSTNAPGLDGPLYPIIDTQVRFDRGTVWSYRNIATRMATPEIIQQAGTISIPWQPAKGDLIIHKIEIIRGTERIDALSGGKKLEVLRREKQLERFSIDGELTATLAIDGLQVGDLLEIAFSISSKEDVIAPAMQDAVSLPVDPLPIGFGRTRLIWAEASKMKYKLLADGVLPKVVARAGEREVLVEGLLPKAAELPTDAPPRLFKLPIIEVSSFDDWAAVSRVMAPYYQSSNVAPGGDLAKQIAAIKASSNDPLQRTAAALQLVQEKVRYLYNGLDKGNYAPQSVEQTWTVRYGDCKAKTLLLLTILRALGIEAEAMLAHTQIGGLLPNRLPSALAFNHVIVHATIADKEYWLDGTMTGTRLEDLADVPPFGWGLPVRETGAELVELPLRAPQRPIVAMTLDLDQRAGIGFPTVAQMSMTLRGELAAAFAMLKSRGSQVATSDTVRDLILKLIKSATGNEPVLGSYSFDYDPATAAAEVRATSAVSNLWWRENGRWRFQLDRTVSDISFDPDRARAAWQAIPVWVGNPQRTRVAIKLQLPEVHDDFAVEGDAEIDDLLANIRIDRKIERAREMIALRDDRADNGGEIAPGAVAATRERVALAKSRLLTVVAPEKLPQRWEAVQQARKDGRFKPIIAIYSAAIANKPDDANGYVNRANFYDDVYDYAAALADLDQAVKLAPNAELYRSRAALREIAGQIDEALEDRKAAAALEPTSTETIVSLGGHLVRHGQGDAALALVDKGIAQGGKGRPALMARKADFLAWLGRKDEALQLLDAAVTAQPGSTNLLNERCWIKAQLNAQLDSALKDCTKAIELSESSAAALDSRALVYFRLGRFDDALADLAAALDAVPHLPASLYLRGIINNRLGKPDEGKRDLAAATFMSPLVADEYQHFGITP